MKIKNFVLSLVLFTSSLFPQINWEHQQLPPIPGFLLSIDVVEKNFGFSGGWKLISGGKIAGTAVYTTNGGDNWELSAFPDSTRAFIYSRLFNNSDGIAAAVYNMDTSSSLNVKMLINNLIKAKNHIGLQYAKLGYVEEASAGGMILRTTNGGADWQTVSALPDTITYILGGHFFNPDTGFVIAKADTLSHILKTTDGGMSWDVKFNFPPSGSSTSLKFSSSNNGIASGYVFDPDEQGFIAVTTDGGENWEYQIFTETGNMVEVDFTDENTFYASAHNFGFSNVYKSTNAGLNWNKTSFSSDILIPEGIDFIEGTGAGFIFGSSWDPEWRSAVYRTVDGGNTWSDQLLINEITGYLLNDSKIIDENTVYITGGSVSEGIILKSSDASLPVEDERQNIPDKFLLKQNYPNPFNPTTNIEYHIAENSFVTLKVYDILGNELVVLVNEEKQPGVYKINFTAKDDFASGIYFYRITVSGGTKEVVSTKKMLLVK